jgi:hypothetical protein
VQKDVNGSLQLPLPSMNRINQIELATLSILPWFAFFMTFFLQTISNMPYNM